MKFLEREDNIKRVVFDSIHAVFEHNVFDSNNRYIHSTHQTDMSFYQMENYLRKQYDFEGKLEPVIVSAVGFMNDGTIKIFKGKELK